MASVDSTDLIQLIFREKNKSLKIFGIFCFKDLTFYGGDIAGRNPAVGFIRSEAPWSSANSLAAADLVMEWDEMGWWQDDIGWHWMTSSERWKLWKLLSWRLDILPAKFRSTADTLENLQISIPSIHPHHFRWRHKCCCRWVPWKYSELPKTSEIFLQTI